MWVIHLLLLAPGLLLAQWPEDDASNLVLCDRTGEQTLPKVVGTSDGGCWISWQDLSSGNYDTWVQRLDADGVPQWEGGLRVSDHPQESWITDYDLAVDHEDHAIVAINDARAGSDRDIYAYRISPAGEFVWGEDGLTLSANEGFEPDPRICITDQNNVVVAWQEDSVIHLRKVSPAGADLWDPAVITLSAEFALSIPRLAVGGEDGVLVQWLEAQGSQFWSPRFLRMQHVDAGGSLQWGEEGLLVQDAGGFGPQMRPDLIGDGHGGAWSFWYDARANELHAYVQRVLPGGTIAWEEDGVLLATTAGQLQMEPRASIDQPDFGFPELDLVFRVTNSEQSQAGIAGQRLSSEGERLWGDGGLALAPISAQEVNSVILGRSALGMTAGWLSFPQGDALNSRLVCTAVSAAGEAVWEPEVTLAASSLSQKGHLAAGSSVDGMLLAAWRDHRDDSAGDLLLQNINPDGSLGPMDAWLVPSAAARPAGLELLRAWPNPFNPVTRVSWRLDQPATASLLISDLLGRTRLRSELGMLPAGSHQVLVDGSSWPAGSYLLRIETERQHAETRLLLLK